MAETNLVLLSSPPWREQLQKFSYATGLNLAVFAADDELCFPVITQSPLARHLTKTGVWENLAGPCLSPALQLARQAVQSNEAVTGRAFECLALMALPLRLNNTTIGALVAGWVFDSFPDPVVTERLGRALSLNFPEIWQVARQQQPVPREKLKVYAELLQTLADSYLNERVRTIEEQDRSRDLHLLNQASRQMSAAISTEGIREILTNTITHLTGAEAVRFLLVATGQPAFPAARDDKEKSRENTPGYLRLLTTSLRVPVETADGHLLGTVEIINSAGLPGPAQQLQITTLAAQAAVALQKIQLIRDLQNEQTALAEANHAKDEFLSVLSHELRTPLNPILGWIRMLRRDSVNLERGRLDEIYEAIERNALRELKLIEEILELSRILNNKIQFELTQVNPADVLAGLVALAQTLIGERSLQLRLVTGEHLPLITIDAKRIEQALGNLVVNAVKFTPDGGTITLGLQEAEHGSAVEFYVADTGIGIAPADLDRIFERFRQVDSSTKRRFDGLGIGLSVVQGLVNMLGGRVWAVSAGEGQGATFTVRLPATRTIAKNSEARPVAVPPRLPEVFPAMPATDAAAPVNAAVAVNAPSRLLIVDDTEDTLILMDCMLRLHGYEVVTAASVDEAWVQACNHPPDLIISDLGMPGKDGFDLLQLIKNDSNLAAVPVVALSGYTGPAEEEKMLAAGFSAHLPKPVEEEELLAVIRRLAANSL